jgi:hypothetical protein
MRPGPLLDSFLEAGGIAASVRLLRKSTDPAVLVYTSFMISHMMNAAKVDGRGPGKPAGSSSTLADKFNQAGALEKTHKAISSNTGGRSIRCAELVEMLSFPSRNLVHTLSGD